MKIEEADKVLLSTGETATIDDVIVPGEAYVGEFYKEDRSWGWGMIEQKDIDKVLEKSHG